MNKTIRLIVLICTVILYTEASFCQTIQPYSYEVCINYKMTYQSDSTDKKSTKTESMSLLIGKEQSMFIADRYLMMDSAFASEVSKGNKWGPPMTFYNQYGTRCQQVIFKGPQEMYVYEPVARFISIISVYEEPKSAIQWNILPDTLTIAGYACQTAETQFGHRKWIAWFSPEIPVSDGPYKFNGLPGLVLKINDSQNYWSFELTGIKNISKEIKLFSSNKKIEKIKSKEAFFKQRRYSLDNQFEIRKADGDWFSDENAAKKMYEKEGKANNNWIELYKP